jgi:hypothetical protein
MTDTIGAVNTNREPGILSWMQEKFFAIRISWEAFVIEANQPEPTVIATLSAYGTEELIHSLQLVYVGMVFGS